MAEESERLAELRDRLQEQILAEVDEAYVNGHPERRLPGNLNISFAYVEGESVLMGLNRKAALSSGSACTSATLEPSYVICGAGGGAELAHSSIRFGLHRFTTEEEVDYVASGRSRSSIGCARCRRSTSWPRKAWIEVDSLEGPSNDRRLNRHGLQR